MKSQICFHGGTGFVTGANFLLSTGKSKILLDCGMVQGPKHMFARNYDPFAYSPKEIDYLLVSHAHIDHIGRIPMLVKQGFKGKIISTHATKDLARLMLEDAQKVSHIQAKEFGLPNLFELEDIDPVFKLWESLDYHEPINLKDSITMELKDAGHILGSAIIELKRDGRKFVYTGDLGNTPAPLLKDTETITDANYMIIESVYGDRVHEQKSQRITILKEAISRIRQQKGTLLIPAFSLQRTQILLYEINKLVEDGIIEPIPVYLDSPLAEKILEVFRRYSHLFNDKVQERLQAGDDIFSFPKFVIVKSHQQSRALLSEPNPKIIISASGMSTGGRVLLHEKELLRDPRNIILFVGYQSVYSLGRQIQDGNKIVKINGEKIRVRAQKMRITGFSAHKDLDNLVDFVSHTTDSLEKCFVVMGEPKSSLFLTQRLREYLNVDALAPELGSCFNIKL